MLLQDVEVSRDDLLEWLRQQPADKIVHDDTDGSRSCNCLVATYLQEKTGNENVSVGYYYANDDYYEDDEVTLGPWFASLISTVDMLGSCQKVTAERALEIVENFPAW